MPELPLVQSEPPAAQAPAQRAAAVDAAAAAGATVPQVAPAPAAQTPAVQWRRWVQTENLGLSLTLGYLFLSGLGMMHRALVFMKFRINIMDYAEPSDFLVSALRDPLIIIACVAPIPIVALYFRVSTALSKRAKTPKWAQRADADIWREKMDALRRPMYLLTMGLWALAASLHYARRVAEDLRAGKGQRVRVELISDGVRTAADTTAWLLLGTTHSYLFF